MPKGFNDSGCPAARNIRALRVLSVALRAPSGIEDIEIAAIRYAPQAAADLSLQSLAEINKPNPSS
ncbi:MAG TPA: hypothetical protein VII40_06050 [Xanthobacteraceae bacterium]|jgi:hypothetical protein